ncbi:putative PTPS domain-containing protein [Nonlabens sp. YIK11]|uniref:glycosyltransferase 87 family protein n=1 Tax=Nonlabens sp. YIK11 TaxID=1453349 RepID=UPI0006DC7C91|nr:glycosyltransferase 87 family protein [Nonlabens sp. YIK11]KQC31937.1 putative PTPS domain-containing protein [Nonlabens sp. YIK11]
MKTRLQNGFGILLILSFFGYAIFSSLSRKQFLDNLLLYSGLFVLFLGFYWIADYSRKKELQLFPEWLSFKTQAKPHILAWLLVGVALRLVFLWDTPNLSQDFFRFIWDGHMLLNGYNPYLYLPDELIATGVDFIPNADLLHASMGELSSGHYTNYPPFNQLFFAAAAFLGGNSIVMTVVWMRIFIIVSEVLIFLYGIKLLRILGKPEQLILLYYLNPFILIELTGNLHWEGVMACLMLIGVYHFICYDRIKSPIYLGLGVLLKLLPVIIFPLLLKSLKWRKLFLFFGILAIVVIAGFAPFLSEELFEKYGSSVGLWFNSFEFNASVYYVIRAIGYEVTGYNIIGTVGKILPLITLASVILMAVLRKNQFPEILLGSILFSFTIYLLLSTTVHPWYLTIPLLFSVFTRYRYMMVWSFLVFVSYSAYSNASYQENLWWIAVEYLCVVGMLVFELLSRKRNKDLMLN